MNYVQGTNEMTKKTLESRRSHDVTLGLSEICIIGLQHVSKLKLTIQFFLLRLGSVKV